MKKNLLFLLLFVFACEPSETKFAKELWAKCTDGFCEYREAMIHDLMLNHLKKGMTLTQLRELLGKPDYVPANAETKIGYNVYVDYDSDIDPVETKTLQFEIKDSIIINYELEHWKQK